MRFLIILLLNLCYVQVAMGDHQLPFTVISSSIGGHLGNLTMPRKSRNIIITDEISFKNEFEKMWQDTEERIPNINFNSGIIVFLDMGLKADLGYDLAVRSVISERNKIRVSYFTLSPGVDCPLHALICGLTFRLVNWQ